VQGEVQRTLISQLQHAADMYRGGFLEEFTLRDTLDFDNWVGLQRSYWYSRIGQVFAWLSQMQSEEGAIEQAIATVDRWLSLDPLNEDIYLRLMQLHFSTGNRAAALKAYETCLAILMTELHAKPSSKMVALADFIRNSSPPHRASRHEQTGRGRSASRTLLEIPFVGRGAELTRLMTLYEKASSGQFQVVMIEGEAGIGKSRLAAAYLDWAKAQGASVLKGRAFKTSSRLSYQLLIDALRSQLEQGQDLHHLLSDIWLYLTSVACKWRSSRPILLKNKRRIEWLQASSSPRTGNIPEGNCLLSSKLVELEKLLICSLFSAKDTMLLDTHWPRLLDHAAFKSECLARKFLYQCCPSGS